MSAEELQQRKRTLRKLVVERILALDPERRRHDEALLAASFAALPGFAAANSVLLFVTAFPEEIATGPLLMQTLGCDKHLVCPRVDRLERRLRLFRIDDPARDLEPGTRGIPEPRPDCLEVAPGTIDWALVPGLAFNVQCYRLGRGAGHYDRLLPALRPDAQRWALIHDCQWVEDLPVEPHDVALDGVVSPRRVSRSQP